MAQIIWTEPAIADLEAIADYIALENPTATKELMQRVMKHTRQLAQFPQSGTRPGELGSRTRYRQLIEPPCRIFYRHDGTRVFVVHIMRTERLLRRTALRR